MNGRSQQKYLRFIQITVHSCTGETDIIASSAQLSRLSQAIPKGKIIHKYNPHPLVLFKITTSNRVPQNRLV